MKFKRFEIWTADLNPGKGTEPGKIRPVVIVQTDLLNNVHPSTIICPISTNVFENATLIRVHLKKQQLKKASDILVDQIREIDNRRFLKKAGKLNSFEIEKLKDNLKIILDL